MNDKSNNQAEIDHMLFWPPLLAIVLLCALIVLNPEAGNNAVNSVFAVVTGKLGWTYEIFVLANIGLILYFIFGKYAKKRFGDEKPEFSTLTWLGMLFTAGTTGTIFFWATIEFYYFLSGPPFGLEPFSPEAWDWSMAYSLFNWGIGGYGLYVAIGVVFGYFFFVQKKEVFRPSTACETFLGKHASGAAGKVIDIFYMIGVIAGVSTSIGLGTPIISELITKISGIQHTLGLDAAIIVIWTIIFTISVYSGLEKGIAFLSNVRVYLGYGLLIFIILVGPTTFMLNNFFDALGISLNNFMRMSLYTDAHLQTGFPQGWTIFFYAWFMSFALSTGIYLARISKGRTVREFALGATFSGVLSAYLYFAVLGNYSIQIFNDQVIDVTKIFNDFGAQRAVVEIWNTLPLSMIVLPIFVILIFISTANVINSVAYTLAMVSSKELKYGEEPGKLSRIVWAVILGCLSLTLMFLGGLKPLQTSATAGSFPTMIIMGLIFYGFLKGPKQWD
ncbi:L-carnitine/gamma-butyrobetaine antiporter [Desulfosporosinus meridiei]|uniref:Choline/carnitine/betaine transport n=1 Tax=Desulfosporosinus meridiei (strain ATCC BAA-275 / DSM 13257 / KCTC 12902 / NCIMB 13706 / S10) TaxID=768704 RepID=J7IRL1_DESMD|nr:L-carnitine/gamma-butyrobetaine antiporter [Desulfosporosinus meridiei]AFQ44280.1 choline/carnitine/betaine transport [Desulfosporosinus meridiei DSM 13257]